MQKSLHSDQYQILLSLLRQARIDRSVTQELLSANIGMSQSDISKVERGVRRLDIVELRLWLRGLGVSIQTFSTELDDRLSAYEAMSKQILGRKK
jgi:transcriptional regulator with XRE-family HTH domain